MIITHIASNVITVEGLYMRQRCVWCGVLLQDIDLSMTASPDGSLPGSWECGSLVTIDGNHSYIVEGNKLPDSFCHYINSLI